MKGHEREDRQILITVEAGAQRKKDRNGDRQTLTILAGSMPWLEVHSKVIMYWHTTAWATGERGLE